MTKEIFEVYVETQLTPTLDSGDVVILDNLSAYKNEEGQSKVEGAVHGSFLLPYSPNLNPTGTAFWKVKAQLRCIGVYPIDL